MKNLYTIGYSVHPITTFTDLLKEHGIELVIDVRSIPSSRDPNYTRGVLPRLLRAQGIDYRFGGRLLGGLSTISVNHADFVQAMQKAVDMSQGQPTALMCAEKNPAECHRAGKLTAWVHRNVEALPTFHIVPGDLLNAREFEPKVKKAVFWPECTR